MERRSKRSLSRVEICTWNVAPRWRSEIGRAPDGVVIVSPYLTSSTAESVVSAASVTSAEVYTVFETELFVNGGSSISTVKKLVLAGYRLFHVSGLHAKMVIAGSFASIGSQNLTRGGTTNRELTVLLRSDADVTQARRAVERLKEGCIPITIEMIEHVEAALPRLRRRAAALLRDSRAVDAELLTERELVREEQARQEAEQRREAAERLQRELSRRQYIDKLQAAIRHTSRARTSIDVALQQRERPATSKLKPYWTLKTKRPDADLLRWLVDGSPVELEKRSRYLLLFEDTGRLTWPALNHTQISKFGTALSDAALHDVPFVFGRVQYKLDFKLESEPLERNLQITLSPWGRDMSAAVVGAWFLVDSLRIGDVEPRFGNEACRETCQTLRDAIEEHPGEFDNLVRARLLKPFVYKKNRTGDQPSDVFEGHGTNFRLRLHLVEAQPVLVATRLG